MKNKNILTSADDVINYFTTVPHCNLTMEQLAKTAFKVAKNEYVSDSVQIIVPHNLIDTVCNGLKKHGETFIDHYDFDDLESVDDDYNKEYIIWINFNLDVDDNFYKCHFQVSPTWRNGYYIPEYQFILCHKDVSLKLLHDISSLNSANRVVTFDLLA